MKLHYEIKKCQERLNRIRTHRKRFEDVKKGFTYKTCTLGIRKLRLRLKKLL